MADSLAGFLRRIDQIKHGREDAERGEALAARIQAEAGCLVADRRSGRIVEFGRSEGIAAETRAAG